MISEKYKSAKQFIEDRIDTKTLFTYQGVLDITDNFDFQEIAGHFDLSNRQYNSLIEHAQKYGEQKIKDGK